MALWDSTLSSFNPRMWLKMDQQTIDGTNGNGSIQNWTLPPSMQYFNTAPTASTTGGQTGAWINFPSTGSNYITMQPFVGYIPEITAKTFTIGIWFKRNGVPATSNFVLGTWGSGQAFLGMIIPGTNDQYGNGGRLIYNIAGNASGTGNATGQLVTDNNWHFAAMTLNGTSARYYFDGALIGQQTGLSLGDMNIQTIHLAGSGNYQAPLAGGLDDFFLCNTVLTDSQISQLYAATLNTAPLKYWNGTNWVTPIDIKRWYNGQWNNIGTEVKVYTSTGYRTITK
jgi:hypothetical protein